MSLDRTDFAYSAAPEQCEPLQSAEVPCGRGDLGTRDHAGTPARGHRQGEGRQKGRPISIDVAHIKQLRAELGPAAIAKRLGIARKKKKKKTRTDDRQPHQHGSHPRPLVGDPARRRFHPHRHGDSISDHSSVIPEAERCCRGSARARTAGVYVVHARLDYRSGVTPHDRSGTQQGRIPQQPGARGVHPQARGNPRQDLREPATSRLRPQPARHRNHLVEHAISRARRRNPAQGRGCPRSAAGSPVPTGLGARQPDRRLMSGVTSRVRRKTLSD